MRSARPCATPRPRSTRPAAVAAEEAASAVAAGAAPVSPSRKTIPGAVRPRRAPSAGPTTNRPSDQHRNFCKKEITNGQVEYQAAAGTGEAGQGPQVRVLLQEGQGADHRLQGHRAAAYLHQRARQDPCPSGDRQLCPAPARRCRRGEERPRGGSAAVQLVDAVEGNIMKLILTAEVEHLGVAGDAVEVKDGY